MVAKSFEDLEVFQGASRLSLEIHRVGLRLPGIEQWALGDRVRRASKSIPADIAEGFGKPANSKFEFGRFLRIAMGSAEEMRVWIRYCLDLGYIDAQTWPRWRDEYHAIAKMIRGLQGRVGGRGSGIGRRTIRYLVPDL
jgi:four helix bundle protein